MKPEYETTLPLFRLRVDAVIPLQKWLISRGIKGNIIVQERSSSGKEHLHCVFASELKITALRTSFRRTFPEIKGTQYSFNQNWSKETKSKDMKLYMKENELSYRDIHIIYILKDNNIISNTLVSNPEELDFEEIRKEIGCKPKSQKKYGNYLKKLIMEYNEQFPEPLIDTTCLGVEDYQERERIFRFVTHQLSAHNLDIFLSNAKRFDNYVIKQMCQSILNTRKYSDIYPGCYKEDINKYFFD